MSQYQFAFDLDGTITKHEVLPIIAEELGIGKEMAELTRKNLNGDIPYNQGFTKRVAMLKKIPINRVQTIIESVTLSQAVLDFLHAYRDRCIIVTANLDIWIKSLIERIGIRCLSSEASYKGDQLFGIKHIIDKSVVHKAVTSPVVAIGDGNNDFDMLRTAPVSIAFGGIHLPAPSLMDIADYAIYSDRELCRFLKQLL